MRLQYKATTTRVAVKTAPPLPPNPIMSPATPRPAMTVPVVLFAFLAPGFPVPVSSLRVCVIWSSPHSSFQLSLQWSSLCFGLELPVLLHYVLYVVSWSAPVVCVFARAVLLDGNANRSYGSSYLLLVFSFYYTSFRGVPLSLQAVPPPCANPVVWVGGFSSGATYPPQPISTRTQQDRDFVPASVAQGRGPTGLDPRGVDAVAVVSGMGEGVEGGIPWRKRAICVGVVVSGS